LKILIIMFKQAIVYTHNILPLPGLSGPLGTLWRCATWLCELESCRIGKGPDTLSSRFQWLPKHYSGG